jgi:hypothetical protein
MIKKRDGRALDHKTLEEIRIRAVRRVDAGESSEDVIHTLGFARSVICDWLAKYREGAVLGLRADSQLRIPTLSGFPPARSKRWTSSSGCCWRSLRLTP